MKCMCAQTKPRFILSSERVLGGMEFEPMLTPREKSPLPENVPRGGSKGTKLLRRLPPGQRDGLPLWILVQSLRGDAADWLPECVHNPTPLSSPDIVCLLVGCLTSQQQASVSQGRICSDNFACCHTEIDVADPTFYLTQSQYTDTGPTSPSADSITPGAWQGSHWSANF